MSVGDKRTAEAIERSCGRILATRSHRLINVVQFHCYVDNPQFLSVDLERCQRRALRIIYPDCSYNEALLLTGLVPLHNRREFLCDKLFNSILSNPSHKLYSLLPPKNECEVNLRSQHSFTTRRLHTIRTRNSFIHHYVHKAMM